MRASMQVTKEAEHTPKGSKRMTFPLHACAMLQAASPKKYLDCAVLIAIHVAAGAAAAAAFCLGRK